MDELGIFLAWALLGIVMALEWPKPTESLFELRRRQKSGDETASTQLAVEHDRPLLESLRRVVMAMLTVVATAATLATYGLWPGILIAFVILLLLPSVAVRWLSRPIGRLRKRYQSRLTALAHRLKPVLTFLSFKNHEQQLHQFASKEELHEMLRRDKHLAENERARLVLALAFSERQVRDVMIPYAEVQVVESSDTVGPLLLDELHKSKQLAFPVIEPQESLKKAIVGMLLMDDIVPLKKDATTVERSMRHDIYYVRHDAPLDEALHAFLRTRRHLFIVVSETGDIVGALSLDRVMKTLAGEISGKTFDDFDNLEAVAGRDPRKPDN